MCCARRVSNRLNVRNKRERERERERERGKEKKEEKTSSYISPQSETCWVRIAHI